MSEEDFLKRWSRRKREAVEAQPERPVVSADSAEAAPVDPAVRAVTESPPEFDPATLPPIESITALSDITAYLRAGVPPELTRAALRHVWTADPSIRDFVGLAENAWDFTDPNAMPGFGPLEASDEVRRMIAEVVDQIGQAAKPAAPQPVELHEKVAENANNSNLIIEEPDDGGTPEIMRSASDSQQDGAQALSNDVQNQVLLQSSKVDIASQYDVTEAQEKPKQLSRRTHGRALPE